MNIKKIWMLISLIILNAGIIWPQIGIEEKQPCIVQGYVYNNNTRQIIDFATILVVEPQIKIHTDEHGYYRFSVSEPGRYSIMVRSNGMETFQTILKISGNLEKDFYIESLRITGAGLTITEERDIQKLSRHTMSAADLKQAPGSLGDSIAALTVLPSVIRSEGFFGPLVIRGVNQRHNNYIIDHMPIYNPMHFGGLHSVINNNFMREIDLYASGFPAEFGSALGGIININTVDEVKKSEDFAEIGILSISNMVKTPLTGTKPVYDEASGSVIHSTETIQTGYVMASARYGFFTLALQIAEAVSGNDQRIIPEYWDYQFKYKRFINKNHSLSLLFIGSSDYLKFINDDTNNVFDEKDDPLLTNLEFKTDQMFHNQAVYYEYHPSNIFENTLIGFSALNQSFQFLDFSSPGVSSWAQDISITSRPNIYGLLNRTSCVWLEDIAEVRTGVGYTRYDFKTHGKTILPAGYFDEFDISNDMLFKTYQLDEHINNNVFGGYIENKLTFNKWTILPGLRTDYLQRSKEMTLDPRIMVDYAYFEDTIISASVGQFSNFLQIDDEFFNSNPDLARMEEEATAEKAVHRAVGIEQKLDLCTIRVEGFSNIFRDIGEAYPYTELDGTERYGLNSGKIKASGLELMLRKDRREKENGVFGWLSYTYTESTYRSGLPTVSGYKGVAANPIGDVYGDKWINFAAEQPHALKLIGGYVFGANTISSRIQYLSRFPYTPIIGSAQDMNYYVLTGKQRHVPIYGTRNSKRFPEQISLTLRYSRKKYKSWGDISWFFEIINLYNSEANQQAWNYSKPYDGVSNPYTADDNDDSGLNAIPGFGVEIHF
ncbi:MAG: carboxypeptidase-like regulatory domain-containing protein [bacterium]